MKYIIYLFAIFILVSSILADNGKCNCRSRSDGNNKKTRITICCNRDTCILIVFHN